MRGLRHWRKEGIREFGDWDPLEFTCAEMHGGLDKEEGYAEGSWLECLLSMPASCAFFFSS